MHHSAAVDAQIEITIGDYQMSHVAHHAKNASQIALLLNVDNGDTAAATHTSHDEIAVVWGEDCTAKGISRAVIAVDRAVERVVEFELLIHYENHLMLPFLGLVGGYVDKTNGVVSPM